MLEIVLVDMSSDPFLACAPLVLSELERSLECSRRPGDVERVDRDHPLSELFESAGVDR